MVNKFFLIKKEFFSYTFREKWFFLLALMASFLIMMDYSIAKPVSNSVFLTHYSASAYPYVWLLALIPNLLAVLFYNRFLAKFGCFRMFCCISVFTALLHTLAAFYLKTTFGLAFFVYLWKDTYILLMLQQVWSVVHSSTKMKRAKYFYGILFGVGTFGSSIGSVLSSALATSWGSERLLLLTIPIYAVLWGVYYGLLKTSALQDTKKPVLTSRQSLGDLKLIKNSSSLQLILVSVLLMQLTTTLMDYRFNLFLAREIPNQDLRTAFSGKVWAFVNTANLVLQFVATFFIVQFLGLKRSQFFLPGLLLTNLAGCLVHPSFSMATCAFATVKTLDYSAFNIIKEMLYVPLSKEEKFKGKALIDVFAYRSAKGMAAIVILLAQLVLFADQMQILTWSLLGFYVIWIGSVYVFHRRMETSLARLSSATPSSPSQQSGQ